uniref:Aa_trans domain-containing protein n=1 Tax=Mesocestoides corti TaxID=53468 RepID=A0A5K3FQZ7_MESCO
MFGRRFGAQPMPVAAVGDSDHPLNTSLSSPKVWKSPTWPFIIAGMPLCVLLVILGFLFIRLPAIPEDQRQFVKLPRNLDDLKSLGSTLSVYKGTCYWRILIAITFVYILYPFYCLRLVTTHTCTCEGPVAIRCLTPGHFCAIFACIAK